MDILAEKKDNKIFVNLISHLKKHAQKGKICSISCMMLRGNRQLISSFRKNGFLNGKLLIPDKSKKNKKIKDFYAYVPEDQKNDTIEDPGKWYITALAREGR